MAQNKTDVDLGVHHHGWYSKEPEAIVEKKWGREVIISRGGREGYATKIMYLRPGYQVSMHWHRDKCETFILISGEITIEMLDRAGGKHKVHLSKPYSSITIEQQFPHTFYAPDGQEEETVFIEASMMDDHNDSYRLTTSGPRK